MLLKWSLFCSRDRGVDVKLDVPPSLWDKPSVEITTLSTRVLDIFVVFYRQCGDLLYLYERDIEVWFYDLQNNITLSEFLCRDRVLKKNEAGTFAVGKMSYFLQIGFNFNFQTVWKNLGQSWWSLIVVSIPQERKNQRNLRRHQKSMTRKPVSIPLSA